MPIGDVIDGASDYIPGGTDSLPSLDGLADELSEALAGIWDAAIGLVDFFGFRDDDSVVKPEEFGLNQENMRDIGTNQGAQEIPQETNAQTVSTNSYTAEDRGDAGEAYADVWGNMLDHYESFSALGEALIALYLALVIIAAGIGLYGKSKIVVKFGRAVAGLVLIALGPSLIAQLMDLSNSITLEFIGMAFGVDGGGGLGDFLTTALAGLGALPFGIIIGLPAAIAFVGVLVGLLLLYGFIQAIIMMLFAIFPAAVAGWVWGPNSRIMAPLRKAGTSIVPTIFIPAGLAFVFWAAMTIPFEMVGSGGTIESALFLILVPGLIILILLGGTYLVLKASWVGRAVIGGAKTAAGAAAVGSLAYAAGGKAGLVNAAKATAGGSFGGSGTMAGLAQARNEQLSSGFSSGSSSSGGSSGDGDDRGIGEKPEGEEDFGATNQADADGGLFSKAAGGIKSQIPDRYTSSSGSNYDGYDRALGLQDRENNEGDASTLNPGSNSGIGETAQELDEEDIPDADTGDFASSGFQVDDKDSVAEYYSMTGPGPNSREIPHDSERYARASPTVDVSDEKDSMDELQERVSDARDGDVSARRELDDRQAQGTNKYDVSDIPDTEKDTMSLEEIENFGADGEGKISEAMYAERDRNSSGAPTRNSQSGGGQNASSGGGNQTSQSTSSGQKSSASGSTLSGQSPSGSSNSGGGNFRPPVETSAEGIYENEGLDKQRATVETDLDVTERNVSDGMIGVVAQNPDSDRVVAMEVNNNDPPTFETESGETVDDISNKTIKRVESAKVESYNPDKEGESDLFSDSVSDQQRQQQTAAMGSDDAFRRLQLDGNSRVVVEDDN